MATQDTKVSVLLTGSVDEQQAEELFGATVTQGSAPTLAASRNTRLTRLRGTCERSPDLVEVLPLGQVAFGVVPEARSKRSVVFATPSTCSRVVADDGASTVGAGTLTGLGVYASTVEQTRQSAFVPAQLTAAGALGGVNARSNVASAYNDVTGHVWYAWVGPLFGDPTTARLYASAYDADGTLLVSTTIVGNAVLENLQLRVGLTAHGANGVRLWYQDDTTTYVRTLAVSGNKLDYGSETTALAGISGGFGVAAQGADYAYVLCQATLHKYDVVNNTLSSATVTGAEFGDDADAAVAVLPVSGGYRIAVACAYYDTLNLTWGLFTDELEEVWTETRTGDPVYAVSCHFHLNGGMGISDVVVAAYVHNGTFPATDAARVLVLSVPLGGGDVYEHSLPWANLQNRGGQLHISGNETYPLLAVARAYSDGSTANPGEPEYVDDPSVLLYVLGDRLLLTPVARFGVVRGVLAPAFTPFTVPLAANPLPALGADVLVPYRKSDLSSGSDSLSARFVRVSFAPEQPSVAHDKDGVALVACALPVQWDGAEVVELGGPLHGPHMSVTTVTGSWAAGVYRAAAIYEWVDSAGLKHRSRPTVQGPFTLDGSQKLEVDVTVPDSLRNGTTQPQVDIRVYVSAVNSPATLHLDPAGPVSYVDDVLVHFEPEAGNSAQPQLYSTGSVPGEELTPQPPPPLRDIAVIGSRAWGVDAEVPSRLVYSKLRISGVGFEFFPAGEVILPSGAGAVLAIREMAGTVVVLAERGVYQIADSGPNNTGSGGSFGPAYKLSDIGCASRLSVLTTPIGVMFLDTKGQFCMLTGGAVAVVPGMELDEAQSVTGAFTYHDADEACFVVGSAVKVFNYALQRWTTWELPTAPTLVSPSAISRDAVLLHQDTVLSRMSSDTYNSSAHMYWETDWILLGGDFQDHVLLRTIIFSARRISAHGVTVSVFTNYETAPTTVATYSASEVAALADASGRYTVKVEPSRQDTRAVKIAVAEVEASGSPRVGMRPLGLTIVSALEAMLHEEAFKQGSFKGG